MREPVFTETVQVALVVRDLEASMRTYVDDYGIGPWEIYEFNPDTVAEMAQGRASRRVAGASRSRGSAASVGADRAARRQEHLRRVPREKGEGSTTSRVGGTGYSETLAALEAKGRRVLQSGATTGSPSPTCRPTRTSA